MFQRIFRAFGEASYFHISNKASIAIQPILITFGIGIDFGVQKKMLTANRDLVMFIHTRL